MTDYKRISSGGGGRGNTHLVQNLEISADLMMDTARTKAVSKENFSFELTSQHSFNCAFSHKTFILSLAW